MNPFEKDWTKPDPTSQAASGAYADITVVFDRSASMQSMAGAVVEGFNTFAGDLRKNRGNNVWTLVQFDDPSRAHGAGETFPQVLFERQAESKLPLLAAPSSHVYFGSGSLAHSPTVPASGYVAFTPRGSTALVDALCETIDRTELRTSGMANVKVVMGIWTDGEENSSQRHTNAALRERIARTQSKLGWDYLYFGANQDSFAQAGSVGIGGIVSSGHLPTGASYTNNFAATSRGMQEAIYSGVQAMYCIASGSVCSGAVIVNRV